MIVYCIGKNIDLPRSFYRSANTPANEEAAVSYHRVSDSAVIKAFPTTDKIQIFLNVNEAEYARNSMFNNKHIYSRAYSEPYLAAPIFAIQIDPSMIIEQKSEKADDSNIRLIPKEAIIKKIFANQLADLYSLGMDFRGFYLDFHNSKKEKYYARFYPPHKEIYSKKQFIETTASRLIENAIRLCQTYISEGFFHTYKAEANELINKLRALDQKESDSIVKEKIFDLCINEIKKIPDEHRSKDYASMLMVIIQDFEIGDNYQISVNRNSKKILAGLGLFPDLANIVLSYIPDAKQKQLEAKQTSIEPIKTSTGVAVRLWK